MTVSALDILISRWSGLLVALATLAGLVAFVMRERTRQAQRENTGLRRLVAVAIICALVAVVGRIYPLVK